MKRIYFSITSALIAVSALAADLNVSPGSLTEVLAGVDAKDLSTLTLKGKIDARDLAQMRSLPAEVKVLDLSGVDIDSWKSTGAKLFDRTYIESMTIPPYCFFRTDLEEVALPEGLKQIGAGAFSGSEIVSLVLPEGITEIGDYAFYDCKSLKSVVLPSTLKKIGKGAFGGCSSLIVMDLSETNLVEISEACFAGCGSLAEVKISSATTSVAKEAFRGTRISMLDLQDVMLLKPYALSGMSQLRSLRLNPSARIGEGALMDDVMLQELNGTPADLPALFAANCQSLDASIQTREATSIGSYAFANSAASTLVLGPGLTKIGDGAFFSMPNLNYIQADALESNIPEVDEHTFDGISRPDTKLYVTDESLNLWASHPEWGQFNIVTATVTDADIITVEDGIRINLLPKALSIVASEPLSDVKIYSVDGAILYKYDGGNSELVVALDDIADSVIVVSAATAHKKKSVKLMK